MNRLSRPVFATVVAAILAAGCHRVDCLEDAALSAKLQQGRANAERDNTADRDRGVTAGLALTREQGAADGYSDGHEQAYNAAYWDAYADAYSDGADAGYFEGEAEPGACNDGDAAGHFDGAAEGYSDGFVVGHDEGFGPGYDAGYSDATVACENFGVPASLAARTLAQQETDDETTCRIRGYEAARDLRCFDRGLEEGKRDNPKYQAGYDSTFADGLADGSENGESDGTFAGWSDGHDAGYADGYNDVYDRCYADGYTSSYSSEWSSGYDSGSSNGYWDGYDLGYNDGNDAC